MTLKFYHVSAALMARLLRVLDNHSLGTDGDGDSINNDEVIEVRDSLVDLVKLQDKVPPIEGVDTITICNHCGKGATFRLDNGDWCDDCFGEYVGGAIDGEVHDPANAVRL